MTPDKKGQGPRAEIPQASRESFEVGQDEAAGAGLEGEFLDEAAALEDEGVALGALFDQTAAQPDAAQLGRMLARAENIPVQKHGVMAWLSRALSPAGWVPVGAAVGAALGLGIWLNLPTPDAGAGLGHSGTPVAALAMPVGSGADARIGADARSGADARIGEGLGGASTPAVTPAAVPAVAKGVNAASRPEVIGTTGPSGQGSEPRGGATEAGLAMDDDDLLGAGPALLDAPHQAVAGVDDKVWVQVYDKLLQERARSNRI